MDDYDHPTWGDWYPNDDYFETPDGALDGTASLEGLPNPQNRYLQIEVVMVANNDNQKPTLRTFAVAGLVTDKALSFQRGTRMKLFRP